MSHEIAYHQTPLGCFEITATPQGITQVTISDVKRPNSTALSPLMQACVEQLTAYFQEKRTIFDLKLAFECGSTFEKTVWRELLKIPYGETVTYSDIAARIGKSKGASQAIGRAVGNNPMGIIVPCHRVVGKDGSLRGFAWGLERKLYLLKLEKAAIVSQGTLF